MKRVERIGNDEHRAKGTGEVENTFAEDIDDPMSAIVWTETHHQEADGNEYGRDDKQLKLVFRFIDPVVALSTVDGPFIGEISPKQCAGNTSDEWGKPGETDTVGRKVVRWGTENTGREECEDF